MSTILSVGIYIDHQLADIYCYRERSVRDVFFQAAAILALFEGCENRRQYLERKYAGRKMNRITDDSEEADLLLNMSDFHLAADLDSMSIYRGSHLLRSYGCDGLHEAGDLYSEMQFFLSGMAERCSASRIQRQYEEASEVRDHRYLDHVDAIASYYRCTLNEDQCEAVRALFLDDDRLFYTLPERLREVLALMGRLHEDHVNRCYDA